ncbi:MAG: hypothetical protein ICV66_05345 [Chitinophagaceae bacterium]|nr:hypothetical protein [Chitinophagaceae bacterium]
MKAVVLYCFLLVCTHVCAQKTKHAQEAQGEILPISINITHELKIFNTDTAITYSISLCADVPNNKKPYKVAHNQETGHVFLILQQINFSDTINKVFGFYPRKSLPTLFSRRTKSVIKDNSGREYDVSISKLLSEDEFKKALHLSKEYAKRSYHLNKFNCYDYAVLIYNAVAGNTVRFTTAKYPFIFGRGGSPVCIYRELKKTSESSSAPSSEIQFGSLVAPISTGRVLK